MTLKLRYSLIFITLLLTCACGGWSGSDNYDDTLQQAELLVDTNPDSTLLIINAIDLENIDCPNKRAKAFYIKGDAKFRMQNFPDAMWSLLHAEKIAQEANDTHMLALSRRKMMELCDSLYDHKGKSRYGLSACEAYEQLGDYDNVYELVSELVDPLERDPESLDLLRHITASLVKHKSQLSDTNNIKRAERLDRIANIDRKYTLIDRLRYSGIRSHKFMQIFNSGGAWEKAILCDSIILSINDLHAITNDLWLHDDDKKAQKLLSCFIHNYSNDGTVFYVCGQKHLHPTRPQPIINELTTRRHIMESFQNETYKAITKFNYEENLLKAQTISYQRTLLLLTLLVIALLIIAIILTLRLSRSRRLRKEEENMRTAMELQSAISDSENRGLDTLIHLCNTYYEGFNKESVKSKAAKEALSAIEAFADSPDFFAQLEERLNRKHHGLMTNFRAQMPGLKEADYRLFLCNALELSIPAICLLLKGKRELIYNRRLRLRGKIQASDAPDKEQFLEYLK